MATRPYVPRADGESSIGVAAKKWGNIFAYKVDEATDIGNNASLGYRQPSTTYATGNIAYHASLPTGRYLECTTAGMTGSGDLTISDSNIGVTVSDGTVTWTIRKGASTQDLTDYLPLRGGAMTGENILKSANDSVLRIIAGTSTAHGAALHFYGDEHPNFPGVFFIKASSSNTAGLYGYPDGVLKWNGNSLDKSAVVAESLGANGYRKYASGLIEQWGTGHILANQKTSVVTLPISASLERSVLATIRGPYSTNRIVYWNDIGTNTTTQIEIDTDSEATHQYGLYYTWYMIAKS